MEGIARSVERYRKGQTYYTSQQRSLWGQERGIRSGQARRSRTQKRDETILLLAAQGWTQRAIAASGWDCLQGGVNKVLKRGCIPNYPVDVFRTYVFLSDQLGWFPYLPVRAGRVPIFRFRFLRERAIAGQFGMSQRGVGKVLNRFENRTTQLMSLCG